MTKGPPITWVKVWALAAPAHHRGVNIWQVGTVDLPQLGRTAAASGSSHFFEDQANGARAFRWGQVGRMLEKSLEPLARPS